MNTIFNSSYYLLPITLVALLLHEFFMHMALVRIFTPTSSLVLDHSYLNIGLQGM